VTGVPTYELARRGLRRTFQHNAFFGELTLLENAMAAMLLQHSTSLGRSIVTPWREAATRRQAERAAAELLTSFGIAASDHGKHPGDIAYGTQRLLSVVLAYGAGAQALLIDEPAAGTGGPDMKRLADLLVDLRRRGVAVVVIEHHMDLIMAIADRIVVIDQGRKLAEGLPAEIQRNEAVLEAYLGRAA
jgi:branched-chain amino acid transport system ATP-binding protein